MSKTTKPQNETEASKAGTKLLRGAKRLFKSNPSLPDDKPPGSFSASLPTASAQRTNEHPPSPSIPRLALQPSQPGVRPSETVATMPPSSFAPLQTGSQSYNASRVRKAIAAPDPYPYTQTKNPNNQVHVGPNGQAIPPVGQYSAIPPRAGTHPGPAMSHSKPWTGGPLLPPFDQNGGLLDSIEDAIDDSLMDGGQGLGSRTHNFGDGEGSKYPSEPTLTGTYIQGQAIQRYATWETNDTTWEANSVTLARTQKVKDIAGVPAPHTMHGHIEILKEQLKRAEEDKREALEKAQKLETSSFTAVREVRERRDQERFDYESVHRELMKEKERSEELNELLKNALACQSESQEQARDLQTRMESLQTELEKLQKECQDYEAAQDGYIDTINRLRVDFGPHLSDDHFKECYMHLRTEIQLWTEDYFKGPITGEHTRSPSPAILDLSPDYDDYVQSPIMRPKLAQALVWSVLTARVFASNADNSRGLWWAQTRRPQLSGLRALLRPRDDTASEKEILDYHKWRATTARLIPGEKLPESIAKRLVDLVDATLHDLKTIRSDYGIQQSSTISQCHYRLEEIFRAAVKIDHDMNKQLAFYAIDLPLCPDRQYNPYQMQVDSHMTRADGTVECHTVGLIMTPMLLVTGKPDGSAFLAGPRVLSPSVVEPLGGVARGFEDPRRGRKGSEAHQGGGVRGASVQRTPSQKPKTRFWGRDGGRDGHA